MITPPSLKEGDKIIVVAPARKITPAEMEVAIKTLSDWGLEVLTGKNLYKSHHQFSGTDEERLEDFQNALDNPEVKAILCARGGYGSVRIIDRLNFTAFKEQPKWIIGYSDITAIHNHIHRHFQTETIHATMPVNFAGNTSEALKSLHDVLFGSNPAYEAPHHDLNRKGKAEGLLTGGNLSMIYSITGTNSAVDTQGKILFIEDLDEYLYHIDRMMMNLDKSGMLSGLAGLLVGGMTDMNDNPIPFGKEAVKIIRDAVEQYKFPVAFNFPAGHLRDNRTLIFGRKVTLSVERKTTLGFSPVG